MFLAGFREAEAEAAQLIEAVSTAAQAAGQGLAVQWSQWVAAILHNGLGRYEMALAEAQAAEQSAELHVSTWALPELIEAATRTGQTELAAEALGRLAKATSIGQTDWAQGIYVRCRALLADADDAESCYSEAISRLGRTGFRPELARAHLLYGEWLRRERRRAEARTQLRTAHDMFAAIGIALPFTAASRSSRSPVRRRPPKPGAGNAAPAGFLYVPCPHPPATAGTGARPLSAPAASAANSSRPTTGATMTARQTPAACGAQGTGTRGSTARTEKTGAVTDTRPA